MKPNPQIEAVESSLAWLPSLPATIRYYDDFCDRYRAIVDPDRNDTWVVEFDGAHSQLDFKRWDICIRPLVKSWCAHLLCVLSPASVRYYLDGLRAIPPEILPNVLCELVLAKPTNIRSFWNLLKARGLSYGAITTLKSLLHYLCAATIAGWGPEWHDLVSQLPLPQKDKYASIRIGDVFLTVPEESAIIKGIDEVTERVIKRGCAISTEQLCSTALLACNYQYGMRPKQIAMLRMRDVQTWNDGTDQFPAVHLTFTMIKQRWAKRVLPLVRRVKREWSPIFVVLYARAQAEGKSGDESFFGLTPHQVATSIADRLEFILGKRRTATELRHSAAQRLVDAGATEEELAAFMGHTDLDTGLVYFRSSVSQAQRVNRALGLSPVYQRITRIAHNRFISSQELAELKGEQQLGGVPHGI
jgi:integrase